MVLRLLACALLWGVGLSASAQDTVTQPDRSTGVTLKQPENITESVEYDENDNTFRLGLKLGDSYIDVPVVMTPEEYNRMTFRKSMQSYFKDRYQQEVQTEGENRFDFTDLKFDLGPAEKIFGPGGVQVKTSGSATIKFGYTHNNVENPSLSVQNRRTGGFDFDEQINLNVNASVGDKVNLNMNYNTEATWTADTKKIKFRYEGKDDEIVRLLEAGNVSFPTNSSLINGATSLFGIRSDLQFGKLNLQMVLSQKESTSNSVSSRGGDQLTDFEIDASDYDENRHFFLAHYFRDNFDKSMSMLPTVLSGIRITRIELWVTNKRSNYDDPRNIVAFSDLGESRAISNSMWNVTDGPVPSNGANDLYSRMNANYSQIRNLDAVAVTIGSFLTGGTDYEKISNARKLKDNEYTLNADLGFVSLRTALTADEVLAVAFEFTYNGKSYQVGEFASDLTDSGQALMVKLLKSNSNVPGSPTWDLMMKNVYSITSGSINSSKFKLNICYASDSTGSRLTYLPEQSLKGTPLLRLLGLDRLDDNQGRHANGKFDFIEGYTVLASSGKIIFPVVEPFGSSLRSAIGDDGIAGKYMFQELYDSTRIVASRIAEKDKFVLVGEYSGSGGNVIQLGAGNIPRGSVVVTAGGVTLVENSDYRVDYSSGTVTIINQSIIDAGTSVNVRTESNTQFSMQRKTMAGVNWAYDFSNDLQLGGTLMHLNEKPLTSKVVMGAEPLVNSMYGLNINWKHESQGLTNLIDKFPFVNATAPSNIVLKAEMAHLNSSVSDRVQGSASYIDDFEEAETGINIAQPSAWSLSSVPTGMRGAGLSGNVESGYYRALLNWFTIDPLFTRRNSSLTPSHLKSDLEQLSDHYVREIYERELYPNKETVSSESTTLQVLNLAYYPQERGPYNLNPNLDYDGHLMTPEQNWGGIMRKINQTDFEASNIEYIEFWMLDPFIKNPNSAGGSLFINLGEVSEDVLADGKKFFENGLPVDGNPEGYESTVWGKVPTEKSLVYAFDNNSADNRALQDVGLNGLSSEEERNWPAYASYLAAVQGRVSPQVYQSIYDDPAADTYHYYRGSDYDDLKLSVMDRYRRYNGTEGNSPNSSGQRDSYDQSSKTTPDVEDANGDFTLDEYEKYFQYEVSLRPQDLSVGRNFIADKREVRVKLRNGKTESVNWYLFRIPLAEYQKTVGSIRDFSSIRFMRMYLTGFREETHIRFGTLELMTSQWRNYEQPIAGSQDRRPQVSGLFTAASVNIEENGDRQPVNYVMPPGITRILDPNQTQLIQDNEQAMSLKVTDLGAGDARAIYKKVALDLRKYQRIQMFSHAEELAVSTVDVNDGDFSVFVRLGSDYAANYYEYEIPLKVTPAGFYSSSELDRAVVWPDENRLDIEFSVLTAVKEHRNRERNAGNTDMSRIYSEYDPARPANRISVVGNPSVGNVKAIMIGVRNNSLTEKSAEVWVNELRLVGYESHGGTAAQGSMTMRLSDIGTATFNGQFETAGFGGLEDHIGDRSTDNRYRYAMTTNFNLGRFLPEKARISIPLYYSYTKENVAPQYSPYDTDMYLDDVLDTYPEGHMRDSIRSISQNVKENRNFSISNASVDLRSDTPMPYDPANFSFSYSVSEQDNHNSTIDYEHDENWKAAVNYTYSTSFPGWKPFSFIEYQSNWLKILKETTIHFLPQSFVFDTDLSRNYHELQERDLEGSADQAIPVTFSQQFYWNRDLTIRWDMLKELTMSFNSRTRAEIAEPYVPVNRNLYPDEYEFWKDSIKASLRNMGTPLDYQQNFQANYRVPLSKLPILNWTDVSMGYNAGYTWNRGIMYEDGSSFGNNISSRRDMSLNGRFDLTQLYNKSEYLKSVNDRHSGRKKAEPPVKRNPYYQKEYTFLPDSVYVLPHNLATFTPKLTATTKDGKEVKLRFRKVDMNNISVKVKDTLTVKIRVVQDPDKPIRTKQLTLDDFAQFGVRTLMGFRNVSFSYRDNYNMMLPGFLPYSEHMGQAGSGSMLAPGLDFAFGMIDDGYLYKAKSNGWLLSSDSVVQNAMTSRSQDFQLKVTAEPFTDFRIDINASWTKTGSNQVQYGFNGMPSTRSGSFNMTTMTLGSAFEFKNSGNGYRSASYDRFLENLGIIRERIETEYAGAVYPEGTPLAGQEYTDANGGVNPYSADVMVPAFLSAYTGRSASRMSLDLFPDILSMLPGWNFTYSGLVKIPFFEHYFKSFNLRHAYKSVYSIGNFNTFNTYMEYMNGRGFITDVTSGMPVPSSMYNIGTVSINETFAPLAGFDMTLKNGISGRLEYRKTRVLTLSTTAVQIVESMSDDITLGGGYKIVGLKLLGALPGSGRNKVSNDLTTNLDISYRNQSAICRSINNGTVQATSGNRAMKFSFTADYVYSKMVTLNGYIDYQSNFPMVSTTAYPTSTYDFGFSIKFSLTR